MTGGGFVSAAFWPPGAQHRLSVWQTNHRYRPSWAEKENYEMNTQLIPGGSLVVMVGSAASGKSTLAARIAGDDRWAVISADDVRGRLFGDPRAQGVIDVAHGDVHAVVRAEAAARLRQSLSVIVDATNLKGNDRTTLVELGRALAVPVVAIIVHTPLEECRRRNAGRERQVPDHVLERHATQMTSIRPRALLKEGFDRVIEVDGTAMDTVDIRLLPGGWDRTGIVVGDNVGGFDVLGDIHGCLHTFNRMLEVLGYNQDGSHPEGRILVSVGDFIDRGAHSFETYRRVRGLMDSGRMLSVSGNHEEKAARWLAKIAVGGEAVYDEFAAKGKAHGLRDTLRQALDAGEVATAGAAAFMDRLPHHMLLDGGRLAVVHGALRSDLVGQFGREADSWMLYGAPIGKRPDGYPERLDWQEHWDGDAFCVAGHTVVSEPRIHPGGGGSLMLDLGAAFGRNCHDQMTNEPSRPRLGALRWPECDIVEVDVIADDLTEDAR